MTTYVALLRGINVGGHNKIPMKVLQAALVAAGCVDVQTYIQSGNLVFRSVEGQAEAADLVRRVILATFALKIPVILRSAAEWADMLDRRPLLDDFPDLSKWYVAFFDRVPSNTALDPNRSPGDRFELIGREAHLYLGRGVGVTKLSHDWFERQLGVVATIRNWNTVLELRERSRA